MKDQINKIKEFHKAFGIEGIQPPDLRHALMKEENDEYLEACEKNDEVGIADSIGDMLYVLIGTAITHKMENLLVDIFNEIHDSNMSKLDENGNPIINGEKGVFDSSRPPGKVLKSKNFKEPNIEGILNGTHRPYKRFVKLG